VALQLPLFAERVETNVARFSSGEVPLGIVDVDLEY
jgi:hypothetical protein